ncbi:MAG: NYN domain-containing protein [Candidatus Omnitrophica bacterium]|nr:NYN domain-containing protein [Candidatus Omnitrophota bacterium]
MRTIILDGYNVIYKIPELTAKLNESLKAARTALAMLLSTWKKKYLYNRAYIVFDGKDNVTLEYPQNKVCGIDCFFTGSGEEADERIIALVRKYGASSEITVISDDNKVRNNCKAFGVKVESPSFLQETSMKSKDAKKEPIKRISAKKDREITDYYINYLKQKGRL